MDEEPDSQQDYERPRSSAWIVLGAGIGMLLGYLYGNPGVGMVLGAAVGLMIRGAPRPA